MKMKSIKELKFSKNVISKFSKKNIVGGIEADKTYTSAANPMTSCNGKCNDDTVTAAINGCQ